MTRPLTLLCLLAWCVAAAGSSPAKHGGIWRVVRAHERRSTREHRIQRYLRVSFPGRIDDVLHLRSSRRSRTR